MTSCVRCGEETQNPKFCSRSCAATYNNAPRKKQSVCLDCGCPNSPQRTRCRSCYKKWQRERTLSDATTLEEAVLRYGHLHRASAYALVRTRARSVMKDHTSCQWCGYDKHTEVAHRKAISEFPPSALLSEINHPDNLLALCPNCHWEHDKLDRRE